MARNVGRKTFSVLQFKEYVNNLLEQSADGETEFRRGLYRALERVLHDSLNYNGFNYLQSEYAAPNATVDERDPNSPVLRRGYDPTRRRYY